LNKSLICHWLFTINGFYTIPMTLLDEGNSRFIYNVNWNKETRLYLWSY